MEFHYRAFNGRLVIKGEGSSIKDLFEQIGPIAEVLDADQCCGKCQSVMIYPRAREAKKADGKTVTYYELVCGECGAKLSFGQHSEGGTLWPKRVDENGNQLENRGWRKYQALPPASASAPSAAPSAPTASAPRPQPVPVQTISPEAAQRIETLVDRCQNEPPANVFGELCDALAGVTNDKTCDRLWDQATRKHGNPIEKPAAVRPVVTDLVIELERASNQMRRRTA